MAREEHADRARRGRNAGCHRDASRVPSALPLRSPHSRQSQACLEPGNAPPPRTPANSLMRDPLRVFQASKHYSREQRARSWWHLGSTFFVAAASATGVCLLDPLWLRVLASVLLGLVLVRLFIVHHDVLHGTILTGSRLARAIMTVYGLLVLNPPRIWARSHGHHHRNVGKMYGSSIGSFPIIT